MPTPLHFSDEEKDLLLKLAQPIDQRLRPEFLAAVAAELEAGGQAGAVGIGSIGWRARCSGAFSTRRWRPTRARRRALRSRPGLRPCPHAGRSSLLFFLDACTVKPYITKVKIGSVQHRGLLRLIEDDDARELPPDLVKRLRNILAMLLVAEDMAKVSGPPGWRIHQLKGDRAGTWSVSVSGNWRLTFAVESSEVRNLDLEDYH